MELPESVAEIAEVIGREAALFLIGQLPTCYAGKAGHKSNRVILYVPKTLKPDHRLVQILGWHDALKLARWFGGEILQPANCQDLYRKFRDAEITRMLSHGVKPARIAEMMNVSERHVRNLSREIPQEEWRAANDNTARDHRQSRENSAQWTKHKISAASPNG